MKDKFKNLPEVLQWQIISRFAGGAGFFLLFIVIMLFYRNVYLWLPSLFFMVLLIVNGIFLLYNKDMNVKDIEYLFTHPIRCGKTEAHTVREWLTQFGIPIEDEYFIQWHKTISILSPLIQKAITKIRVDSMNQILNIIFVKLYMDYDLDQDFFPQFISNRDMMIKMMNDLPIHGGE